MAVARDDQEEDRCLISLAWPYRGSHAWLTERSSTGALVTTAGWDRTKCFGVRVHTACSQQHTQITDAGKPIRFSYDMLLEKGGIFFPPAEALCLFLPVYYYDAKNATPQVCYFLGRDARDRLLLILCGVYIISNQPQINTFV